ncbi:uncharacterized protein [Setaria viridis]|uniref:uncharacterized protein isoform X2 n=1 Tax=Setaria viridis TaxID=4556 RepID=UPI003B3ADAB0
MRCAASASLLSFSPSPRSLSLSLSLALFPRSDVWDWECRSAECRRPSPAMSTHQVIRSIIMQWDERKNYLQRNTAVRCSRKSLKLLSLYFGGFSSSTSSLAQDFHVVSNVDVQCMWKFLNRFPDVAAAVNNFKALTTCEQDVRRNLKLI